MGEVKIKICGLFRDCDIRYVNETKPDYAGFVFYPPSHRYVDKTQIRHFRILLDESIQPVGVFVNVPVEETATYLNEGLVRIAQLHGQEDEGYIHRLRKLAPGCEIWKAFKVRRPEDLQQAGLSSADQILLDNGYGTGNCFDWGLIENIQRPFLLAGGLNAGNVREAVDRFHPYGLDISSGVETEKQKDLQKIREITEIIRRR